MKINLTEDYPGELEDRADEIPGLLQKSLTIKPVKDHDRRHNDRYKHKVTRDIADKASKEYARLMNLMVDAIHKVMATEPEDFKKA